VLRVAVHDCVVVVEGILLRGWDWLLLALIFRDWSVTSPVTSVIDSNRKTDIADLKGMIIDRGGKRKFTWNALVECFSLNALVTMLSDALCILWCR
jgi:hypothetical protein